MAARNTGVSLTPTEVMKEANAAIESAPRLQDEYAATKENLTRVPAMQLESISSRLMMSIAQLEITSGRAIAGQKLGTSLERHKEIHGSVSHSLAQVIEAAQALGDTNWMDCRHYKQLEKIASAPNGPLRTFYDEAMAIVQERAQNLQDSQGANEHLRMRAA